MTIYTLYEVIKHDGDRAEVLVRYDRAGSLEEAKKLADIELAGRKWEITKEETIASHDGTVETWDAI